MGCYLSQVKTDKMESSQTQRVFVEDVSLNIDRFAQKEAHKDTDNMNSKFTTLIFVLLPIVSFAQSPNNQNNTVQQKQVSENAIFQLFPTKNYWTFIKLDTRNGKMWQVHFSVKDDVNEGELILNSIPLVKKEEEVKGRFTLYPTENIYNFLLLDQIDGDVYQVQWSMEKENRIVIPIY